MDTTTETQTNTQKETPTEGIGATTPTFSRFDYVKYDGLSEDRQAIFKSLMMQMEAQIEASINSPRAKASALTNLEIVYMWIGKGLRDDQIARHGTAPLQEQRCNS